MNKHRYIAIRRAIIALRSGSLLPAIENGKTVLLKNTQDRYGWISIALHWIGAAGVIWLYFLGEDIEHAKEAGLKDEALMDVIQVHVSIGLTFFVFLAARVYWHIASPQPRLREQRKALTLLARAVMWAFLTMITVQLLTGPIIVWSAASPLNFFDIFSVPSPFSERVDWLHEAAETVHVYSSNLFWPLIVLHTLGALKHLVIDRDGSFQRMVWPH